MMAMSDKCRDFVSRWMSKADSIELNDLDSYFDKFITLFVVYNRLYAEATFDLWRNGTIQPADPNRNFPDGKAAKEYVAIFLGEPDMTTGLESEPDTAQAIDALKDVIAGGQFNVLLRGPLSSPNPRGDARLLARLNSPDAKIRGRAALEIVYSVRCNTFHGSKGFDPVQRQVLDPCIRVVHRLIGLLQAKLA